MEQEQDQRSHEEDGEQPGLQARLLAAATVGVPETTTENDVLGQQQWAAIHERWRRGQSVSAIARDLDLDRKTVRTALSKTDWKPYRRRSRGGALGPHMDWLRGRAADVNYSARVLHQELCAERGFEGCYEVVKQAVRPLRADASAAGLTQCRF